MTPRTKAREGRHGGRPPVITDDMPHAVLRCRMGGETFEQIQSDLVIPTGERKGQNPGPSSICRGPVSERDDRESSWLPEAD